MDLLKVGGFQKITPKPVFWLCPGHAFLPHGLKFVYARIALLSEMKEDVTIPAPNRGLEANNLIPCSSELPAVWSDISNALRGLKDHSLHNVVLDVVLGLELSNFSRQLKMKPRINNNHQVIVECHMTCCSEEWRSRNKKSHRGRTAKTQKLT